MGWNPGDKSPRFGDEIFEAGDTGFGLFWAKDMDFVQVCYDLELQDGSLHGRLNLEPKNGRNQHNSNNYPFLPEHLR